MASGFARFRNTLGMVIAGSLVLMALFDPSIMWFTVPAVIGGVLLAGSLFLTHRSHRLPHLEDATDASDTLGLGMFNLGRLNPAGIGGLGLILMAAVVASRYSEIQLVLGFGLTGGLAMAAILVAYRRRHVPAGPRSLRIR